MRQLSDATLPFHYPPLIEAALQRMLMLDRLHALYRKALSVEGDRPFFEKLLTVMGITTGVSNTDMEHVPRSGSVLAVANHPFGFIEGCILAALLPKIRPDVKIMANSLLSAFPGIGDVFIYVNPFGGPQAARSNQRGLREAVSHLRGGGMLVVFPAGEVAHVSLAKRGISDPKWNASVARMARLAKSPVLPVFFTGANSVLFQLLGLIHPRLRTALLPHEFFNKQHHRFELRIGSPIPAAKLEQLGTDEEVIAHLRRRVYTLKHRAIETGQSGIPDGNAAPIVHPSDKEQMEREINALPSDRTLYETGGLTVYIATADEIPTVLREIGRLRELTFRAAGEGTGKAIDLDGFDAYYQHLFVWNAATQEVVGAYRLGATDVIRATRGKAGLYTSTLFEMRDELLDTIGTALELGRSFVRSEYQKSYVPLLLLWKGIGAYVARNPRYKALFGPVSISNDYHEISRQLMVTFFRENGDGTLMELVKARSPFQKKPLKRWDDASGSLREWDIEDLDALVADIEIDQKGLPVLLRQYLKLGGRLLGFNVDRDFAHTLDGLILVDLTRTDLRLLQRYLGKDGAARFLAYHAAQPVLGGSATVAHA